MPLLFTPPHLFIFGVGYVGHKLAGYLQRQGWSVSASCATTDRATRLTRLGLPTSVSTDLSFINRELTRTTHLVSTVPPVPQDPVLRQHASVLSKAPLLTWLAYLSSTSVYGDHAGQWVNEQSAYIRPADKGRYRLEAENEWALLAATCRNPISAYIMRLAGIYGEGRSAVDTLRRNPAVLRQTANTANMYVSRVHVDDIVGALAAAMLKDPLPHQTSIFNIADDEPATRKTVFRYAADQLVLPPQQTCSSTDASAKISTRNRDRGSKKVCNSKMKQLLLPKLKYPTYRHGLSTIARNGHTN